MSIRPMHFPCTFAHTLIFFLIHIHQCCLKILLNEQYSFYESVRLALIQKSMDDCLGLAQYQVLVLAQYQVTLPHIRPR